MLGDCCGRRAAAMSDAAAEARVEWPPPSARRLDRHPTVVPLLAAAFLLSGAAGLMHEVVWTRLLGHLFGVSSFAVSTVLAAFMGGLALGSFLIGARSGRLADPRRVYALLEIGIGAYAL